MVEVDCESVFSGNEAAVCKNVWVPGCEETSTRAMCWVESKSRNRSWQEGSKVMREKGNSFCFLEEDDGRGRSGDRVVNNRTLTRVTEPSNIPGHDRQGS